MNDLAGITINSDTIKALDDSLLVLSNDNEWKEQYRSDYYHHPH